MRFEKIEIPLSKTKLMLLCLASLVFIALGAWFTLMPDAFRDTVISDPVLVRLFGILCIALFGFLLLSTFRKFLDKAPGIVISAEGITENSNAVSLGFIPWKDIAEIRERRVVSQVFISVILDNPEEYIARQTSSFKKYLLRSNLKSGGSIVSITANSLKTKHKELKALLDLHLLMARSSSTLFDGPPEK